jgi:hypothetical protein
MGFLEKSMSKYSSTRKSLDELFRLGFSWEKGKRQAKLQNQLPKLEYFLSKQVDILAQIRLTCLRFDLKKINFTEFSDTLHIFQHPLAESYIVQYGSRFGDFNHHQRVVDWYLPSSELYPQPQHILIGLQPLSEPYHFEAIVRLNYGLGTSLIALERFREGKMLLEKAKSGAARLGISVMTLDSELGLAMTALSEGDHRRANKLLAEFSKFTEKIML